MSDYVLLNDVVQMQIRCNEILAERDVSSTSDHLPIVVVISVETNPHILLEQCNKLPSWHRVTDIKKEQYQSYLSESLSLSSYIENGSLEIGSVYNAFVSVVNDGSDLSIPRNGFNPKTKPYWTHDVKEAHKKKRLMRRI